MLLVEVIVYVFLLIKTFLSSTITYFKSVCAGTKQKATKVKATVKKYRPGCHNLSVVTRQKCSGCTPQKQPVEPTTPSRFLSNKKLTKKDLENASFTKPTLSSLMKKNRKPEVNEEFSKSLRKYKGYNSTNSISSYTSASSRTVKNKRSSSNENFSKESSSNENISECTNKQLCYANISEVQQMDEVVNDLPPIPWETCVITEEEVPVLKITTVKVYTAETVRQYESDDSQIFTDESPEEYPRSTPDSRQENVSEDSQIYSEEEGKETNLTDNSDNSREEHLRQRIQNGLAKIDKLAEEMDAENDPLYRRVFSNLKKATIFLCESSDDWELGKRREQASEQTSPS